jgi:hypothetical protein
MFRIVRLMQVRFAPIRLIMPLVAGTAKLHAFSRAMIKAHRTSDSSHDKDNDRNDNYRSNDPVSEHLDSPVLCLQHPNSQLTQQRSATALDQLMDLTPRAL